MHLQSVVFVRLDLSRQQILVNPSNLELALAWPLQAAVKRFRVGDQLRVVDGQQARDHIKQRLRVGALPAARLDLQPDELVLVL